MLVHVIADYGHNDGGNVREAFGRPPVGAQINLS
jgi:hypothetical protein